LKAYFQVKSGRSGCIGIKAVLQYRDDIVRMDADDCSCPNRLTRTDSRCSSRKEDENPLLVHFSFYFIGSWM
jgi:hypothetical protein